MEVTPEQLCDKVMELLSRFKADYAVMAEQSGLTKVQLFALYAIDSSGELPMGQMACVLHCDASNITGIVDRLVAQGLAARKEHPTDRRTKNLVLTEKGKMLITRIKAGLPAHIGCDKLSGSERTNLCRLIQKMQA